MADQSLLQRCSLLVERIKKTKEDRSQEPQPLSVKINSLSKQRHLFKEIDTLQTARLKSFNSWPHFIPNSTVMSSNGWFYTGINDRVLCIYCDTICHQWLNTDDPEEVHRRLAPLCPFLLSTSSSSSQQSTTVNNQTLNGTFQPHHPSMCDVSRRIQSFNNSLWTQTSPTSTDLALAGFFYAEHGNTVTCFYCNGTLHKWGENDSPKIEHARWFPNCLYARHLSGDRLYNKIQMTNKQLSKKKNKIDDDSLLRLVNARLDLPVVQRLRDQYRLAIIKRCIEEQLKNNQEDFATDNDLVMACFILQKQVDIIQGSPDKMIIPSQNQMMVSSSETSDVKLEECLVCLTEERQIACMPCGHLVTCVPCGYSLRVCALCREQIQSFVRIYC